MKKVLFIMLLSCCVFVLGCDKSNNEIEEVSFEEVISNDINDNEENNEEINNQQKQDIITEALNVGMEQTKAGKFNDAIETYTKAIKQVPDYAGLYSDRGRAKRDSGDLDGAIEDETKALELSQEATIYAERGVSYKAKGEKELALKDFKKALELDSSLNWVKESVTELETK